MTLYEKPGRTVTIHIDGTAAEVPEGCSVAVALIVAGAAGTQRSAQRPEEPGVFCGMGSCFECVLRIDGESAQRTCITPVRDGMRAETKKGEM